MDTLAAKLLLTLAFPIVVTSVWQRLTRSSWSLLLFALGAYIVVHIVIIPVGHVLPHLLRFSYSNPDWGYYPYWTADLAIKGLFTEGIHWLSLRFGASEVKFWQGEELSWQEGVLFGLGYGCIKMLTYAGSFFYALAWDSGVLSTIGPYTPAIFSLFQPRLGEAAVRSMNDMLPWGLILNVTVGFGVTSMIFSMGSSLALFFSIQRQSVTLFLVAVVYYTVYSLTPEFLNHSPFSTPIRDLGFYLIVSLPFLLIFRLRKTLPKARA
jgi:hypothetical protein